MGPSAHIVAILMLNAVYAAPPLEKKPDEVVILQQENNFNGIDPWHWSYKTSDGQSREESGALTADRKSVTLEGSYTWTSPEGVTFTVTYTADGDHGFVSKITQQGVPASKPPAVPRPAGGMMVAPVYGSDDGCMSLDECLVSHLLSSNTLATLIGRRK